jgi:tRNA1Val (adenine37-N6)-methyltransferase
VRVHAGGGAASEGTPARAGHGMWGTVPARVVWTRHASAVRRQAHGGLSNSCWSRRAVCAADVSFDTLRGAENRVVTIRQGAHAGAFRFGLDAILLATDVPVSSPPRTVVDLGAGCGIAGLCTALRYGCVHLVSVEVQPSLARHCEHNLEAALPPGTWRVIQEDVRRVEHWMPRDISHRADLVLCNPPFFTPHAGKRETLITERQAARQELHGVLENFMTAAAACLNDTGAAKFVIPPARLADVLSASTQCGLHAHTIRCIHPAPHTHAYLLEIALRLSRPTGGMVFIAPACIRGDDGRYTEEIAKRIVTAAGASATEVEEIERVRGTCRGSTRATS